MQAPKSDRATELLKDAKVGRRIVDAIRNARSEGKATADVSLDGKKITIREVTSATSSPLRERE